MYNRALRLIREYHRLTRTEMAEKLGFSKSYISELERGKKPSIEVIERYAQVFRLPVSSLMLFAEHSQHPELHERFRRFTANKVLRMLEWVRDTADREADGHNEKIKAKAAQT
jgi:transcriptional regulator with XRE-family HTH domain